MRRIHPFFIWSVMLLVPLLVAGSSTFIQAARLEALHPYVLSQNGIGRPIATTGCNAPAPAAPGSSIDETLRSGGLVRVYRLHIPLGYLPTRAAPLVLSFHGHGSNVWKHERATNFSALADQEG